VATIHHQEFLLQGGQNPRISTARKRLKNVGKFSWYPDMAHSSEYDFVDFDGEAPIGMVYRAVCREGGGVTRA
jgi:hypothetical protein